MCIRDRKYVNELVFTTENDTTTIYQQSVIKPYWKRTNSRVSTYVVPVSYTHLDVYKRQIYYKKCA